MSFRQLSLRLRLALWYTLALGAILLAFSAFVYVRARADLLAQVDAALTQAAGQASLAVAENDGRPVFQAAGDPEATRRLNDDFAIYLLTAEGVVLDTLSDQEGLPVFPPHPVGFHTLPFAGDSWRVYTQMISVAGREARLLAAQELELVDDALTSLGTQLTLGVPLGLLLAGLGGYFLAGRALRPIDAITRTAQAIADGDLNRRIAYRGPADEVGRLALTFDAMLDRLQAAFVRERRFTGDAAHELRTPLTALKGRVGVTLSRPRQPEAYRATLVDMEEQIDRLIRLSNDLLFIARLDQGQFRPHVADVSAAELLASLAEQMRPLAAARSIELVNEVPADLTLRGDVDLLIRLLLNLLDNAVKYTPPGGQVVLRGEHTETTAVVSVHNTGPGIAAEQLPHLFERFYRAEDNRARATGGAGLGLAIAWEIARFHGGELTAESEAGRGATFFLRLPLSPASMVEN